jgi:hypothetical protein
VEEIDHSIPVQYYIPIVQWPDQEEIVITKSIPPHGPIKKKRKLQFSNEEKAAISQNEILSDESINLAQNLLSMQFSNVGGFMDTVLSITNGFSVVKTTEKFIQVLHTTNQHWICVANMDENREANNAVEVYDSLSSGTITPSVATQFSSFCFSPTRSIRVEIKKVQQQENGVDCGLYAIAFATTLAFGEDPTKVMYDPLQLRGHLISCFEDGKMRKFPTTSAKGIRCRNVVKSIEIFCKCRMPYSKDDNMVEFPECWKWYHDDCEIIPNDIFKRKQAV